MLDREPVKLWLDRAQIFIPSSDLFCYSGGAPSLLPRGEFWIDGPLLDIVDDSEKLAVAGNQVELNFVH
jgi:hypothetical protein